MNDVITEEVKDPQALLKAYRELQDDIKALRDENKELKSTVESLDEGAVSTWKERAIKAEAKSQLVDQGIKNPDRVLKYLQFEGIEVSEDGSLKGLDTKLDEVKNDFPELFDAKKRAGRNSVDIHEVKPPTKQLSDSELQVARLFGKTG